MVHHNKPTTLAGLQNLSKLSMHNTGNEKEKSPTKPELPDLLETSPNKSPTPTSPNTKSGKGSSQSKQNNNNSGSTQGKGSTSKQKNSITPNLSLKLGKDGKLTPQEYQCCLDNKLASFVAPLDMSPKTFQNPAWLPPKPKHPSLIRTKLHLPAWL